MEENNSHKRYLILVVDDDLQPAVDDSALYDGREPSGIRNAARHAEFRAAADHLMPATACRWKIVAVPVRVSRDH